MDLIEENIKAFDNVKYNGDCNMITEKNMNIIKKKKKHKQKDEINLCQENNMNTHQVDYDISMINEITHNSEYKKHSNIKEEGDYFSNLIKRNFEN